MRGTFIVGIFLMVFGHSLIYIISFLSIFYSILLVLNVSILHLIKDDVERQSIIIDTFLLSLLAISGAIAVSMGSYFYLAIFGIVLIFSTIIKYVDEKIKLAIIIKEKEEG